MIDPADKKTLQLEFMTPASGRSVGRPAVYASAAERQKAYRERRKVAGFREVRRVVRDTRPGEQIKSDIIDLSAVSKWRHQVGTTLVEVMAAIGLLALVVAGIAQLTSQAMDDAKAITAAEHLRMVTEATKSYLKDNFAAVTAVATPAAPAMIKIANLQALGYLDPGFSSTNVYGQTTCIVILEPAANKLDALVVTTGGTTIGDGDLASVVNTLGSSGGAMYTNGTASTNTEFLGGGGAWKFDRGSFHNGARDCNSAGAGGVNLTPGHPAIAIWFDQSAYDSGVLYREAIPGRPELNRMSTALDMNSNAINNVATIALNTPVIAGAACATAGVISRDAAGAVLSCQGGTWQPQGSLFWKDPVATIGALPACNAASTGHTRVVQTPSVGTGPRAYTCSGAAWQALAVDDAGNLTVARDVNAANGRIRLYDTNPEGGTMRMTAADGTSMYQEVMPGGRVRWVNSAWTAELASVDQSGNIWTANNVTAANGTVSAGGGRASLYQSGNNGNLRLQGSDGQVMYQEVTGGRTRWVNNALTEIASMDQSGNLTLNQSGATNIGYITPGWAVETGGCSSVGAIAKSAYNTTDGWAWNGKTLMCVGGLWTRATGPAGPQGPAGVAGAQGPQGPQGPAGTANAITCPDGQAITAIAANGTETCGATSSARSFTQNYYLADFLATPTTQAACSTNTNDGNVFLASVDVPTIAGSMVIVSVSNKSFVNPGTASAANTIYIDGNLCGGDRFLDVAARAMSSTTCTFTATAATHNVKMCVSDRSANERDIRANITVFK